MHFTEIIKLLCEKERHILLCILKLFTDIIHELSLKNAWLPPRGGDSYMEQTGMLVGNFEFNP